MEDAWPDLRAIEEVQPQGLLVETLSVALGGCPRTCLVPVFSHEWVFREQERKRSARLWGWSKGQFGCVEGGFPGGGVS